MSTNEPNEFFALESTWLRSTWDIKSHHAFPICCNIGKKFLAPMQDRGLSSWYWAYGIGHRSRLKQFWVTRLANWYHGFVTHEQIARALRLWQLEQSLKLEARCSRQPDPCPSLVHHRVTRIEWAPSAQVLSLSCRCKFLQLIHLLLWEHDPLIPVQQTEQMS